MPSDFAKGLAGLLRASSCLMLLVALVLMCGAVVVFGSFLTFLVLLFTPWTPPSWATMGVYFLLLVLAGVVRWKFVKKNLQSNEYLSPPPETDTDAQVSLSDAVEAAASPDATTTRRRTEMICSECSKEIDYKVCKYCGGYAVGVQPPSAYKPRRASSAHVPKWLNIVAIVGFAIVAVLWFNVFKSHKHFTDDPSSNNVEDQGPKVSLVCNGNDDDDHKERAYFYYDSSKDSDHRALYRENPTDSDDAFEKYDVSYIDKTNLRYQFSCSGEYACDEVEIDRDTLELHRLVRTGLASNPSGPDVSTADFAYQCKFMNAGDAEATLGGINSTIQQIENAKKQKEEQEKADQLKRDQF